MSKQRPFLAVLALTVVAASGCRQIQVKETPPGRHHGREDKRVFAVYVYSDPDHSEQCLVDWPIATLWKSAHQTMKWVSDDGGQYTVDFAQGHNGSPFSAGTFVVPGGGEIPSGDLTQSGKYYDYAIRSGDASGKICKPPSDPGLYVK